MNTSTHKNNLAPIVLFVYNRPWHTQKTVKALQANLQAEDSILYIFSDAPKNKAAEQAVKEVRALIRQVRGFKKVEIVEQEQNFGLAKSVIHGVTEIIEKCDKVIVLEDDLVTSPYFLKYMNFALDFYVNADDIYSVTGFNFSEDFMQYPTAFHDDVYLNIRPMSWSWGTWKKNWQNIDWQVNDFETFINTKNKVKEFNRGGADLTNMLKLQMKGKLDSWYIRWTYNAFLQRQFTIYPRVSFINNIGHDSTGVHCHNDERGIFSHRELSDNSRVAFIKDIKMNPTIVSNFNKAFNISLKYRLKQKLIKLFS